MVVVEDEEEAEEEEEKERLGVDSPMIRLKERFLPSDWETSPGRPRRGSSSASPASGAGFGLVCGMPVAEAMVSWLGGWRRKRRFGDAFLNGTDVDVGSNCGARVRTMVTFPRLIARL